MKHRIVNLTLAIALIVTVGFNLTASKLFVGDNICRGETCLEIHSMVTNALYFPGSLMLIPLIAGIVIDSIGSLNVIIGSQILFFLGSLINSLIAAFAPSSQEDFYTICMMILSFFLSGVAAIGLKLGLFVFLANTFITKVSKDIEPLTKTFFLFIIGENVGIAFPQMLYDISSSKGLVIFIFILGIIMNSVSLYYVFVIYKKSTDHALSVFESEHTYDVERQNYENTWIDQNNPVNQDKGDEESYYNFLKEGGIVFACGILSISYLDSSSQFLPMSPIVTNTADIPYVIVNYFPFLANIGLGYLISKIKWDELRLIGMNIVLFLVAEYVLGILKTEAANNWAMFIGYCLFVGLQQPIMLFYLPFMVRMDLNNLGKLFGTIRWVGTFFVVFPLIFQFYVPLSLSLIYIAYAMLKKKEDITWERKEDFERKKKTLIIQQNLSLLGNQIVEGTSGGDNDQL